MQNIYDKVTQQILASLEGGDDLGAWRKPWKALANAAGSYGPISIHGNRYTAARNHWLPW